MDDTSVSSEKWNQQLIRHLLTLRLNLEKEFEEGKTKKSVLWNDILLDLKSCDDTIQLTVTDLMKKYNNLMVTYRRIKKRISQTGKESTSWDFFDEIDLVYGEKYLTELLNNPTGISSTSPQSHSNDYPLPIENDNKLELDRNVMNETSTTSTYQIQQQSTLKKRRKSKHHIYIVKYLKRQNVDEERRHQENITIAQERNVIENKKLEVLNEIRDILKQII